MIIAQIMDAHGYPLKKQGRSWGGSFCPKCGAGSAQSNKFCAWAGRDHKERWFCHAYGARGDVADLMALLEAIPFGVWEALLVVATIKPATSNQVARRCGRQGDWWVRDAC